MSRKTKLENRKIRHRSLRKRLTGTAERPRLVVFRSARHIYAQVVDDLSRRTLASVSDLPAAKGETKGEVATSTEKPKKTDRAKEVGLQVAKICLGKGISKVVFDRAGFKYHGRISAVADGAREGGLQF
jgi:large subunit ribosomal protein L18